MGHPGPMPRREAGRAARLGQTQRVLAAWVLPGGNPILAAEGRRFATGRAIFRDYHPAIPLTVAYSAIFVTTCQEQHGESDEIPVGERRQVRLRPANRPCPRQAGGGGQAWAPRRRRDG